MINMPKFKFKIFAALVGVFSLVSSNVALAHVTVSPKQTLTAERLTFAVSVPNEHDTPVVGVRLIVPEGLSSVRPYAKTGWNVEIVSEGEGETRVVKEIKWLSSGGNVPVNLKDDFLFGAKTPEKPGQLQWKAYETYQDGLVVAWDQEPSDAEDSKPFSVTEVAADSGDSEETKVSPTTDKSDVVAERALYLGVAAVVLSLAAITLAIRKK